MSPRTLTIGASLAFALAAVPARADLLCGQLSGTLSTVGSPHVVTCDVFVTAGDTLTVEAGVEIRFDPGTRLDVQGSLQAPGTAGSPILFVSGAAVPAAGDWGPLGLGTGPHLLDHVVVRNTAWTELGGAAAVTDSTFEDCWAGLRVGPAATGSIVRSTMTRCGTGIEIAPGTAGFQVLDSAFDGGGVAISLETDSWAVMRGLTATNHFELDGIQVGGGNWTTSGTWTSAGIPYVVAIGAMSFGAATQLTLEPGVTVKLAGVPNELRLGTLIALGTPLEPITLTSLLDDTVAGDTNRDASATLPSTLDWELHVQGALRLSNAVVRHSLQVLALGTIDVADSRFERNDSALQLAPTSAGLVTRSTFEDNGWAGVVVVPTAGTITISDSVFRSNGVPLVMDVGSFPVLERLTASNHRESDGIEVWPGTWATSGTWTNGGIPYVLGGDRPSWRPDARLTLEPGVVVKIAWPFGIAFGELYAGSGAILTSISDDTVMGDTNRDGGATVPTRRDWSARFPAGGTLDLSGTTVRHAEIVGVEGDVGVNGSTFEENETGLELSGGANGFVTASRFIDNGTGIYFGSGVQDVMIVTTDFARNQVPIVLDTNAYPRLTSLSAVDHRELDGIQVMPGNWTTSGTWWGADIPYVLQGDRPSFAPGTVLELQNGVVVKVAWPFGIDMGSLAASGSGADPIVITSIADDTVMGDTNRDADATVPGPDDWSLRVRDDLFLNRVTVRHASSLILEGTVDVRDSIFERNGTALDVTASAAGTVTSSDFLDNQWAGVGFGAAASGVSLTDCAFTRNGVAVTLDTDAFPELRLLTAVDQRELDGIDVAPGDWGSGTWTNAGIPYVLRGQTTRFPLASLVLDPGVVVKVSPMGGALEIADLTAFGTAAEPIVLASWLDDSVAGDTNRDGGASTPAPGDWSLDIAAAATLRDVEIRHAETVAVEGILDATSTTFREGGTGVRVAAATNARITSCAFVGNQLAGLDVESGNRGADVTNSTFQGNGVAVRLAVDAFPSLHGLSAAGNAAHDGIEVAGGTWTTSGAWTHAGIPHVLPDAGVTFAAGTRLTLEGGLVVKGVGPQAGLQVSELLALGDVTPITFTSLIDDTIAGDTNGDGDDTAVAVGDWPGVRIVGPGPSELRGVTVRLAEVGVDVSSATVRVEGSQLTMNLAGLRFGPGTTGTVTRSGIHRNEHGVEVLDGALPVLGDLGNAATDDDGDNSFTCNGVHLLNESAATILAENNWWGASPPLPGGIVGAVDFEPWQGVPTGDDGIVIALARTGDGADVTVTWPDAAVDCGYRVVRSADPQGPWSDESGRLSAGPYVDSGAGDDGATWFYRVLAE